jgi:hypothetical protein
MTNVNNSGGLSCVITLDEGSGIMLRRNIAISDSLINGAIAIVRKFSWPADFTGSWFKDNDSYIPISPIVTPSQALKWHENVKRKNVIAYVHITYKGLH